MEMFPGMAEAAAAAAAGGEGGPQPPAADDGKVVDLRDKVDGSGCYGRNVDARYPVLNLFRGDTTLGCRSDADEQLILHVAFKEFVKVRD